MKASLHRPSKAVVDLSAIAFNIQQVAAHLPDSAEKWAVVKADAYGHGAVAVSRHIEPLVDGFCVSNIDEALELRTAGLTKKILILGISETDAVSLALGNEISLTVASLEWLDLLLARQADLTGLSFHIKIDSGMGRIGFRSGQEAEEAIRRLQAAGALVEGIFTHFATADEADDSKFDRQLARFEAILQQLETVPPLVHASNSATVLWHSQTVMNAVRLGDIIYGLNPSGTVLELPYDIKPALSLHSQLAHVKELEAGADVGYGATYTSASRQFIGTIPLGYADGWTRDMQGFDVLIDGQRCPIVGRVSMDQLTVRLPRSYPLGTPVVLIGQSGAEMITATDVAVQRGTINYEVVCLLSDRVPRVYRE
ncbi:alanine racemase [Streptococcus panodentis]|uniref:Alanine racemase n=1 Tax=Streptococcus panodentis TaxID=1581472 RepID=A0ABS5AUY2_9STRE|nr:alanine racemase [Streptococcus panodentis]MBP2620081.1 alanine racemase [Streptococcus panodentis]